MELNQMIDISRKFEQTQQQRAIDQDGQNKAAFALNLIRQMPQEPAKPEEPPRIPSLGALAISN
jgi:hypothetical protein